MNEFKKNGFFSQVADQISKIQKDVRDLKARRTVGVFIAPSYTTTERNALTGVNNGRIIYNSTTNKLQVYAGGIWVDLH